MLFAFCQSELHSQSKLRFLTIVLLLQDEVAEGQKQQQKVLAKFEKEKREASQMQGCLQEQLREKTTALAASQKALADATATANDTAKVGDQHRSLHQSTATSLWKDNRCKDILEVRITQLETYHCFLTETVPQSKDKLM